MSREIADGHLQDLCQLMEFHLAAADLWRIQRSFVIVAKQVLVMETFAGRERGGQQTFWENHTRAHPGTIRTVSTLADAVESVTWRNHPRICRGPLQILTKVFDDSWIFRRHGCKVVEAFVDTGCQACGRHIMPQDAPIHDLAEECGLRNELL